MNNNEKFQRNKQAKRKRRSKKQKQKQKQKKHKEGKIEKTCYAQRNNCMS